MEVGGGRREVEITLLNLVNSVLQGEKSMRLVGFVGLE